MKVNSWRRQLERRRPGGWPRRLAALYGPDDRRATKVVAGVSYGPGEEALIERWTSETMDVRLDPGIGREVMRFFDLHEVRRVGITQGLAGCPHEEGIDYPSGGTCPQCPFWAGRDRWEVADTPAVPPGPMSN